MLSIPYVLTLTTCRLANGIYQEGSYSLLHGMKICSGKRHSLTILGEIVVSVPMLFGVKGQGKTHITKWQVVVEFISDHKC